MSEPQQPNFLSFYSPINNLLRVGRHLMKAAHYRLFRDRAFMTWPDVTTELEAAYGVTPVPFPLRDIVLHLDNLTIPC